MNEHNNGYMMLGRYAVWTSDVNANDKPDLNEAFFIKRERGAGRPAACARAGASPGRTVAGDLPGFREAVLAYTDAVDALGRQLLPRRARWRSTCRPTPSTRLRREPVQFRLSHYPPVAAEPNQFGIAPHTDANFLTFLAQSEVPGLQVRMPSGEWARRAVRPGSFAVNSGDMLTPVDQWAVQVDAASRPAPGGPSALRHPVLPGPAPRHGDRVPAHLPGAATTRRATRPSPTRRTSTGGTTPTTSAQRGCRQRDVA